MSSTGQIVGGIVGAVVGYFAGNPVLGAQIGMSLGGLIDPPSAGKVQGPRVNDLTAQTSTYGAFIPRIYGTAPVVGNIFWIQGNKLIEKGTTTGGGGKGGPSTPETTTFEYFSTFAVGLCEGPISGVRRIWIGGQLWYDAGSSDLATIIAGNESAAAFTLYTGSDTQLADPLIQADHGVANVPAYRGLAYIVFNELPLKGHGNSLAAAQVKVEVVSLGSNTLNANFLAALPKWPGPPGTGSDGVDWNVSAPFIDAAEPPIVLVGQWDSSYATYGVNEYVVFPKSYGIRGTFTALSNEPFCLGVADEPGFLNRDGSSTYIYHWQTRDGNSAIRFDSSTSGQTIGLTQGRYVKTGNEFFISSTLSPYYVLKFTASGFFETSLGYKTSTLDGVYTGLGYPVASMGHDRDNLYILTFGSPGKIVRLLLSDLSFVGSIDLDTSVREGAAMCVKSSDEIYINDFGVVKKVNPITGGTTLVLSMLDLANITYSALSVVRGGSSALVVNCTKASDLVPKQTLLLSKSLSENTVALSTIVQSECLKSDLLTAADLDVTDLTDQVRGYRVSSLAPLRGGIDPLRKAWPFDAIQHGYKIKFKRRGGASVATITEGELDARAAGASPGVQIANTREMDLVLPKQLTAQYLDATREYDVNVAEESRQ